MARGRHSADGGFGFNDRLERRYTARDEEDEREVREPEEDDSDYDEYDDEPNYTKIRIVCGIVIALIIIGIAGFIATRNKNKSVENIIENTIEVATLDSTYEGYKVLGKIKIAKLDVDQYILDSKEEDAMKKGIVKLYGGSLNSKGNVCLAGHNFDNLFGKLNELDIGDVITIVEKDLSETNYRVKDILSVEPDDLTALVPNEDKVELTLVTCENASTKRLVIKAEEKE